METIGKTRALELWVFGIKGLGSWVLGCSTRRIISPELVNPEHFASVYFKKGVGVFSQSLPLYSLYDAKPYSDKLLRPLCSAKLSAVPQAGRYRTMNTRVPRQRSATHGGCRDHDGGFLVLVYFRLSYVVQKFGCRRLVKTYPSMCLPIGS